MQQMDDDSDESLDYENDPEYLAILAELEKPWWQRRWAVRSAIASAAVVIVGCAAIAGYVSGRDDEESPMTATVVDCSTTRIFTDGVRRVAVIRITNHSDTAQQYRVQVDGDILVTGEDATQTATLEPGRSRSISYGMPLNLYGNTEGECWALDAQAVTG